MNYRTQWGLNLGWAEQKKRLVTENEAGVNFSPARIYFPSGARFIALLNYNCNNRFGTARSQLSKLN